MNRGLWLGIMELSGVGQGAQLLRTANQGPQRRCKLMPNREGQQGSQWVKGRGEGRRGSGRDSSM